MTKDALQVVEHIQRLTYTSAPGLPICFTQSHRNCLGNRWSRTTVHVLCPSYNLGWWLSWVQSSRLWKRSSHIATYSPLKNMSPPLVGIPQEMQTSKMDQSTCFFSTAWFQRPSPVQKLGVLWVVLQWPTRTTRTYVVLSQAQRRRLLAHRQSRGSLPGVIFLPVFRWKSQRCFVRTTGHPDLKERVSSYRAILNRPHLVILQHFVAQFSTVQVCVNNDSFGTHQRQNSRCFLPACFWQLLANGSMHKMLFLQQGPIHLWKGFTHKV